MCMRLDPLFVLGGGMSVYICKGIRILFDRLFFYVYTYNYEPVYIPIYYALHTIWYILEVVYIQSCCNNSNNTTVDIKLMYDNTIYCR